MGGKQSVPQHAPEIDPRNLSINLRNKVAIITGGDADIGYETAKAIAVMGAHTIIACRSKERATAVSHHNYRLYYHVIL